MALMTVEISADPQIWGIINLDPKKSFDMRAPFFYHYFTIYWILCQFSSEMFDPTGDPFDPIGAFLGVGRNFWHKKKFLNPPQKA